MSLQKLLASVLTAGCLLFALAATCHAIESAAFNVANNSSAFDASRGPAPLAVVVPDGGGRWTYPGEIKQHLLTTHGYTTEQLARMTAGQLRSLHDAAHEGRAGQYVSPWPRPVKKAVEFTKEAVEERGGFFQRRPVRNWLRCFGGRCG